MTFRVGIIGLGIMGQRMLSNMAVHDAFDVVAVFDPQPTLADLPYAESAESLIGGLRCGPRLHRVPA